MKIKIAERLHPYSHVPGISLLIPGSTISVQIFPALVRLPDRDVSLPLTGPVRDFTVIQDLEHCQVLVSGHAQEGYFRYTCRAVEGKVHLQTNKGPLAFESSTEKASLVPGERLSLGSHKSQDWSLMQQRLNLEELFPIWFRLGMVTPAPLTASSGLLQACDTGDKETVLPAFMNLFLAGFEGLFVPRLRDEQHQGFTLPPLEKGDPMFLLTKGAQLIRQLFIQQENQNLKILPVLPPQFHAGRMTGISCPSIGQIDMEWSKKEIRRLILRAESEGEVSFIFQKNLAEFRLNGKEIIHCGNPILFQKDKEYCLDNFRH